MAQEPKRFERRGPDFWCKMIRWMEVVSWAALLAVSGFIWMAKPRNVTFFDRLLGVDVPQNWDQTLLRWALFFCFMLFASCAFGLFVNSQRHDRKEDRYSITLVLLGILAIMALVAFATSMLQSGVPK